MIDAIMEVEEKQMLQKNSFWQTLDSLNGCEYIDYAAKGLLAYKGVAAYILKGSISELTDCSVEYIANHCIVGDPDIKRSHYDKMEVTVIGLHRNGTKKSGNPLIDMLSVLFDRKMNKYTKRNILEKEYGIRMTRKYNEVIDKMCNISEYWIEPYYKAQKIEENAKKKIADADKKIADAEKLIADAERKTADAERKTADAERKASDAERKSVDADIKVKGIEEENAKLISLLKLHGISDEEIKTMLEKPIA